ncbi:hypothetical protein Q4520_18770 [Alteromonas sp. 1_MG-2023]|uniref:hypothetical protein n=1 Tax=Alteromonas sp. 1_MG-2023 TaxID=3062669 RepID=UPI0026E41A26|nr:hypothetical protein [Alteromonas sp. 1_MG-2023]MDO6477470.1 hypothetical protein [Alteromonas sp. 1_MG-2023]
MSDKESELNKALERLPKEMKPERDLWTGIALSIEAGEMEKQESAGKKVPVSRLRYMAMAASLLLVTSLFIFIKPSEHSGNNSDKGGGDASGQALVNVLSRQHEQQKQQLLVRFQDQSAVTDDWQTQIQELEEAAAAVKLALKQDPDNTALLGMLQHIYQQQLLLIERVHAPKWQQI